MLVKKISFVRPTLLEEIPDIEDYNLDVFVELEDGYTYTVVIATAKNIGESLFLIKRCQIYVSQDVYKTRRLFNLD